MAKDLLAHRGRSRGHRRAAAAGGRSTPWCNAINVALGNVGLDGLVLGAALARPAQRGRAAARPGRGDRRRPGRHPGDHRREPGLRRARRLQARPAARPGAPRHLPGRYEDETAAVAEHLHPRGPRARVLGRRRGPRRHGVPRPAAHLPAVERAHRSRPAGRLRRRGGQGAPTPCSSSSGSAGRWPRAGPPAAAFETAWETWLANGVIEKTGGQPRATPPVDAGCAGRAAGAGASRRCPGAAGWRWPSPSTPRSSTAASPTTPGCRSCPTRSPRSPGTTPSCCRPATAGELGVKTGDVVERGDRATARSRARLSSSPATPTSRHRGPRLRPQSVRDRGQRGGLQRRSAAHQPTPPGSTQGGSLAKTGAAAPLRDHPGSTGRWRAARRRWRPR